MKLAVISLSAVVLLLLYFIAKRFYYHKVPAILWKYDIAILGDSHVERGRWNQLLECRVANFGKGKTIVKQAFEKLPGVIKCKPRVCFIQSGINDIEKQVSPDTTVMYYKLIVDELNKAGIKPVIVEIFQTEHPDMNVKVDSLNERLRKLAPTLRIDITADDLDRDGCHLQGSGYAKWALEINNYILNKN